MLFEGINYDAFMVLWLINLQSSDDVIHIISVGVKYSFVSVL